MKNTSMKTKMPSGKKNRFKGDLYSTGSGSVGKPGGPGGIGGKRLAAKGGGKK
jgi:hypothetical protein